MIFQTFLQCRFNTLSDLFLILLKYTTKIQFKVTLLFTTHIKRFEIAFKPHTFFKNDLSPDHCLLQHNL